MKMIHTVVPNLLWLRNTISGKNWSTILKPEHVKFQQFMIDVNFWASDTSAKRAKHFMIDVNFWASDTSAKRDFTICGEARFVTDVTRPLV